MKVDIHCVTKWSKLDTSWREVTFDDLLGAAGLDASPTSFGMAHCDGGYTTNVPVADLIKGRAMIATHYENLQCPDCDTANVRFVETDTRLTLDPRAARG